MTAGEEIELTVVSESSPSTRTRIKNIDANFTPLLQSVYTGNIQKARTILNSDPELANTPEPNHNCTPLILASKIADKQLSLEFVKLLVSFKAETNSVTKEGVTALHEAASCDNLPVIKYLVEECGEDVNQPNAASRPVVVAIEKGHLYIFNYFIRKGIDIRLTYNNSRCSGITILHKACHHGRIEMVNTLIEMGADINNATNSLQESVFYWACQGGNIEVITLLLSKSVDGNYPRIDGFRPIHVVSKFGTLELVKLLLHNNQVHYTADANGNLPIFYAKQGNKADIVEYYEQTFSRENSSCLLM